MTQPPRWRVHFRDRDTGETYHYTVRAYARPVAVVECRRKLERLMGLPMARLASAGNSDLTGQLDVVGSERLDPAENLDTTPGVG